jgi:hypothetical protein
MNMPPVGEPSSEADTTAFLGQASRARQPVFSGRSGLSGLALLVSLVTRPISRFAERLQKADSLATDCRQRPREFSPSDGPTYREASGRTEMPEALEGVPPECSTDTADGCEA